MKTVVAMGSLRWVWIVTAGAAGMAAAQAARADTITYNIEHRYVYRQQEYDQQLQHLGGG